MQNKEKKSARIQSREKIIRLNVSRSSNAFGRSFFKRPFVLDRMGNGLIISQCFALFLQVAKALFLITASLACEEAKAIMVMATVMNGVEWMGAKLS